MPLPSPTAPEDWAAEIAEEARTEYNGEISVSKPSTPGVRNPETNVVGPATPGDVIISRRPARIQSYGVPIEKADGNGWTVERRVRVQCDIQPGDGLIAKGQVVKIYDGGRAAWLTGATLRVASDAGSSHAAQHSIVCNSEFGRR